MPTALTLDSAALLQKFLSLINAASLGSGKVELGIVSFSTFVVFELQSGKKAWMPPVMSRVYI